MRDTNEELLAILNCLKNAANLCYWTNQCESREGRDLCCTGNTLAYTIVQQCFKALDIHTNALAYSVLYGLKVLDPDGIVEVLRGDGWLPRWDD